MSALTEQAVLGALLIGGDWHAASSLTATDWTEPKHRDVYAAIAGCVEHGEPLDVVSVAERMERAGTLGDHGLEYLAALASGSTGVATLEHHVRQVRAESARRRALVALQRAQRELAEGGDASAVLAQAQTALLAEAPADALPFSTVVTSALEAAEAARDLGLRGGTPGAPTGMPFVDQRTGGMAPGRLWVVAGRPGAGKSAWVLQAAAHAARREWPVAFVSLEMGAPELGMRAIAQATGVSATGLMLGDPRAVGQLGDARVAEMRSLPFLLDTRTHRVDDLMQAAAKWRRGGTKLVVVDYLQRIAGGQGNTRNEQLGDVTRRLKRLCLDLDLCVVLVSSLNRGSERDNRNPVLADLRESGDIEFDADVVVGLRRAGLDDAPVYDVEIGILKNRSGRIGWAKQPYRFDGRSQKFMEPALREVA